MQPVVDYFRRLEEAVVRGWNQFWFTPADAYSLALLRLLTGLAACYFVASHTLDLNRWFAADGILTRGRRAKQVPDEPKLPEKPLSRTAALTAGRLAPTVSQGAS